MTSPTAYFPIGLLAVNPAYIGSQISKFCVAEPFTLDSTGQVATVEIGGGGPLEHHVHPACDSYDEIKTRVQAACQSNAKYVLLSIDSPGGLLAGCFDTVVELRAIAAKSNKLLVAYVDAQATSAAYALCLAADYITIPTTGLAGSIGVIEGALDETMRDRAMGQQYKFFGSGALKTAGNTHVPFTEREAGIQALANTVDGVAEEFFKLVATYRPALTPEKVKGFQAGIFFGANAVAQGLADQVLTLDETIHMLATTGWPAVPTTSPATEPKMSLREYLAKMAESEDASPEDREHAKRALATYDSPAKEPDGDEPKAEAPAEHKEPDGDEPKAEAPAEKPAEERDEPKARALAGATSAEHYAKISALATRPDFTAEQRKTLMALDFSTVKSAVETWPKMVAVSTNVPAGHVSGALKAQAAVTSQAAPVADKPIGLPKAEADALAAQMGLKASAPTGSHWDHAGFYHIDATPSTNGAK